MSTMNVVGGNSTNEAVHGQGGFGMLAVILVMLVVGAMAGAAAILGGSTLLVNAYAARESTLEAAADDGLERARARLNGDKRLYNDTAFVALESDATVTDAAGNAVPGVRRTTWVGPSGISSGQYGVFGTAIVEVRDGDGNRVVRRTALNQESFSKFAYFTNVEGSIVFGGGDRIQGPVHSNDMIRIDNSHATFLGPVTTNKTIYNRGAGTYAQGYTERAPAIPMPQTADLQKLKGYAQAGNTYFKPQNNPTGEGRARMRIEFLTVDLNANGRADNDEAFIRVYVSQNEDWVVAAVPPAGLTETYNCGRIQGGTFHPAKTFPNTRFATAWNWRGQATAYADSQTLALIPPVTRCYLGGDPAMFSGFTASTRGALEADPLRRQYPVGNYVAWTGAIDPRMRTIGRADSSYLFPITHTLNPNFKGVIYVEGKVAVSGVVHGKVTLAAEDNIVIADDVTYAFPPGVGGCQDLLGLFSATDIVVADNVLNAPKIPNSAYPFSDSYFSYGSTTDESLNAVVLALSEFKVENYDSGSRSDEPCQTTAVGRGCLYLTGGIIQNTRGAVGQTNGTGYIKRYSYDNCAAKIPPPYFPTTGRFANGQYFEVNSSGFDLAAYTRNLMARH